MGIILQLYKIPFVLSEENGTHYYTFKGSYPDLQQIYKYFTEFLIFKSKILDKFTEIVKLNFDAYSTHITSIGTNAEFLKSKSEIIDFDELIKIEQLRRDVKKSLNLDYY